MGTPFGQLPSSTGTVLRSVSPWHVPGSSPGRSGWPATPAWSKARSMRLLTSSRTSSTPGSNSTLPRTRLVSRTLLMSLFKLLWVNWRRSLREGGQYFVGNNLSWADLHVFMYLGDLDKAAYVKYPKLVSLYERVGDLPNIKAWVESRPKTDL